MTAAPASADDPASLLAWRLMPARQAHADRLRGCLPAWLSPAAAAQAAAAPRVLRHLNPRLSGPPVELDALGALADWERRLLLADVEGCAAVGRLAGALWHAATLRTLVLREAVREAIAAIGRQAYDLALRHAALTPVQASAAAPDGLRRLVERDGTLCLAAWADGLPPGLAWRARLKLAPDILADRAPDDRHRDRARPIVALCAQEATDHGTGNDR